MTATVNPLRRRIEQSTWLASVIGWIMALWLRFCFATSRWERHGDAAVSAAISDGPILIVIWHEHIMMPALTWKSEWNRAAILTDTSPAARVAGAVQKHLNLIPFAISSKMSNTAVAREVLKLTRSGVSLGLTGDGPRGPARQMKDAPIEWARVTGLPVFVYAFAMRSQIRTGSWDKMVIPMPFTKAASVFLPWKVEVPRRATADEIAHLRADLERQVNAAGDQAERMIERSVH